MPPRILIADDNPVVRTTLRHLLEEAEFCEVIEADNGQQALSQALQLHPDLIILDLVMPVMDGLAAARDISKQLPESPIIMSTLHFSPGLEVETQKFGVRKVVSKGDIRALMAEVHQFLATKTPAPPPSTTEVPASVLPMMPDPATPVIEPAVAAAIENPSVSPVESAPTEAPSEPQPE